MNKKKTGLSKEISSIFDGLPDFGRAKNEIRPENVPASAKGRNTLIPANQVFCRVWKRPRTFGRNVRSILDIGSTSIKWMALQVKDESNTGSELAGLGFIPLNFEPDTVRNMRRLRELLQWLRKETHFHHADLILSEPLCTLGTLAVAKENRSRIDQIITNEMVRRFPGWKNEQNIVSYYVSDRPSREKIDHLHVTTAVVKNDDLQKYLDMIQEAGWQIERIESTPFLMEQILKEQSQEYAVGTVAVLDIEAMHSLISFFRDGTLEYQRVIPVSSENLTEALQRPTIGPDGRLELSTEEAEEIKMSLGIPFGEGQSRTTLGKTITYSQMNGLLRLPLERLIREIDGSINYYLKTFQLTHCRRLLLTGGGSKLSNLDRYLRENLKLEKVDFMRPFQAFHLSAPGIDLAPYESYFSSVIGLSSLGATRLDLRPASLMKNQFLERMNRLFWCVAVILLIFQTLLYVFGLLQIEQMQKTQQGLEAEVKRTQPVLSQLNLLAQTRKETDKFSSRYLSLTDSQPAWSKILGELSEKISEQIYLDGLRVYQESGRWSIMMKGKVFSGSESAQTALSDFLIRVENSESFDEAALVNSHRITDTRGEVLNFELKNHVKITARKNE